MALAGCTHGASTSVYISVFERTASYAALQQLAMATNTLVDRALQESGELCNKRAPHSFQRNHAVVELCQRPSMG